MAEEKIILPISMCTGCVSCVASCPANAIKMVSDENGFFKASINHDRCTKCEKCLLVCPSKNPRIFGENERPTLYALQSSNETVLKGCSSGGAFRLIAEAFLKKDSYVVGVTWNGNLTSDYLIINSKNDLWRLQKTKYMQPRMSLDLMIQIRELLKEGKRVLVSGLPCHIAGLYSFLNKEYENLFTVDLLCSHAPSQTFFKKYLKDTYGERVEGYSFRDKAKWHEGTNTTKCVYLDQVGHRIEKYTFKVEEDNYQRALEARIMCPEHCEKCKFNEIPRIADISLGDFKNLAQLRPDLAPTMEKGVSAVLVNNEKGKALFGKIDKKLISLLEEREIEDLGENGFINCEPLPVNKNRDLFFEKLQTNSFSDTLIEVGLLPKRKVFNKENASLYFDHKVDHFEFNSEDFEEHLIKGYPTIFVKKGKAVKGIRFFYPLKADLDVNKKYQLKIRFLLNTTSPSLNFNLINDKMAIQVIGCVNANKTKHDWVELTSEFVPFSAKSKFMIGGVQLTGEDAFISFDSISIMEI